MKRADIKVGFSCNNRCLFCVQGEKRKKIGDKTLQEIKKELKQAAKDCQEVVLTGGEPTIRPDFLEIVSFAKKLGFKTIQVQSNGRMFYYGSFCEKLIKAGANEFSPALHGHIPELHDYLTNAKGSFKQTMNGIRNLKKLGQKVVTNTVITKSNYRHLPEIARLLVDLDVDQYQFAFVHPLGSALKNFESIVPRMTLIEPYVKLGLDVGIGRGKIVMTEAIPYCFMQGYENYVAERIIPETKIFDYKKIDENFTMTRQTEGKAKSPNCAKCSFYKVCEGPWKEYPEKLGWDEFIPIAGKSELKKDVSKIVDDFLDYLIKENQITKHRKKIKAIKKVIFRGFEDKWLSMNQKFDFSISSEKNGLRFSYNDFEEKKDFREKLFDVFTLFGNTYASPKLEKVMNIMAFDKNKHQTTFGIEWLKKDDFPRIKVYFEELFNVYPNKIVIRKLKEICRYLGFSFRDLHIGRGEKVGAICLDFLPSRQVMPKIYFLEKKLSGQALKEKIQALEPSYRNKILNEFVKYLNLENKKFFYLTKRFDGLGKLLSLKLYKILEVNQIDDDFSKAWLEIENLLKAAGKTKLLKQKEFFEKVCKENRRKPYPVIVAVDSSKKSENIDLYFSFK